MDPNITQLVGDSANKNTLAFALLPASTVSHGSKYYPTKWWEILANKNTLAFALLPASTGTPTYCSCYSSPGLSEIINTDM
ncbi:hypothetical protein JHK85_018308 [Glycine max]|uniref:Uncharacterized protein n=1 Tax=Glycine max TaxID=3847 RepID=A0A0R0J1C5_SOYBN|nr:hypothetical protein JHK85_018308 [Glycine max]KAG5037072.1 hypothetical protein JHK86_017912 [Glycine max]